MAAEQAQTPKDRHRASVELRVDGFPPLLRRLEVCRAPVFLPRDRRHPLFLAHGPAALCQLVLSEMISIATIFEHDAHRSPSEHRLIARPVPARPSELRTSRCPPGWKADRHDRSDAEPDRDAGRPRPAVMPSEAVSASSHPTGDPTGRRRLGSVARPIPMPGRGEGPADSRSFHAEIGSAARKALWPEILRPSPRVAELQDAIKRDLPVAFTRRTSPALRAHGGT